MRIVLTEAPFSYDEAMVKGERYFPLGIGYIASFIRQKQDRDVQLFVDSMTEFRAFVGNHPPDVLGLSAMTSSYPASVRMAHIAKSVNPDCIVIIGGQHATSVGGSIFKESPDIDFIAMGEGELLMERLLREIETGRKDWSTIPGLIYKDGDVIKRNQQEALTRELDGFPFPARDLLPLDKFSSHAHMRFGKLTASLIGSRGCPWKCSYCSSFVTMGRLYRYRSPANVVAEMEQLKNQYGVDNFVFWDDVFTVQHSRVFEFCNEIQKRKMDISWYCLSRSDRMTAALAQAMASAGCVMLSFGIESGSERTLQRIRKQVDLDVVREAITCCNAAGIRTQGTFILGLPFESYEDMRITIDFAKECGVVIALFFSFTPYPGTEEWDYLPDEMKPKSIDEWYTFICNARETRSWNLNFTDEEISEIVSVAHREFYFRPTQVARIMRSVTSLREFSSYSASALSLTWSLIRSRRNSLALHSSSVS